MTDPELIAACQMVADLTEAADRHARAIAEWRAGVDGLVRMRRWHERCVLERSDILALLRREVATAAAAPVRAEIVAWVNGADAGETLERVRKLFFAGLPAFKPEVVR